MKPWFLSEVREVICRRSGECFLGRTKFLTMVDWCLHTSVIEIGSDTTTGYRSELHSSAWPEMQHSSLNAFMKISQPGSCSTGLRLKSRFVRVDDESGVKRYYCIYCCTMYWLIDRSIVSKLPSNPQSVTAVSKSHSSFRTGDLDPSTSLRQTLFLESEPKKSHKKKGRKERSEETLFCNAVRYLRPDYQRIRCQPDYQKISDVWNSETISDRPPV